jgi:hypothetical protein
VNGPQYTVWANRKFVGRNKEEVAQYILYDRETIINEAPELSVNPADFFEKPSSTLLEVRNSIFEDPRPSNCSSSIEGIAEIDPMGACLLTLLSRPRPISCRESI